jgi:hypothetical protein
MSISKAIEALSEEGPALGRPLVDTIKGSRLANLKELRPGSVGTSEVRLLFLFDPDRQAVILVGWGQVRQVAELVPGSDTAGGGGLRGACQADE